MSEEKQKKGLPWWMWGALVVLVLAIIVVLVVPLLQNVIGSDFERPINKDITETICDIYNVGDGTVTVYDGEGNVWIGTPRGQGVAAQ